MKMSELGEFGLQERLAQIIPTGPGVVVGIETDRGLWVHALTAVGYRVYAINPLAVSRYRDWASPETVEGF